VLGRLPKNYTKEERKEDINIYNIDIQQNHPLPLSNAQQKLIDIKEKNLKDLKNVLQSIPARKYERLPKNKILKDANELGGIPSSKGRRLKSEPAVTERKQKMREYQREYYHARKKPASNKKDILTTNNKSNYDFESDFAAYVDEHPNPYKGSASELIKASGKSDKKFKDIETYKPDADAPALIQKGYRDMLNEKEEKIQPSAQTLIDYSPEDNSDDDSAASPMASQTPTKPDEK
jgi:hypothetical protein